MYLPFPRLLFGFARLVRSPFALRAVPLYLCWLLRRRVHQLRMTFRLAGKRASRQDAAQGVFLGQWVERQQAIMGSPHMSLPIGCSGFFLRDTITPFDAQ